jgi:hypothetical protein
VHLVGEYGSLPSRSCSLLIGIKAVLDRAAWRVSTVLCFL